MNDSNISLDRLFDVTEGVVNVGRALSNAFSDPQSINNSGYFNPMNDPQSRRNMGYAQQYPNNQGYGYGYQQPNNGYQNQGYFNPPPQQQNPGFSSQGYFSNNPNYYSSPGYTNPGYSNPGYSNPGYANGWGNDYQSCSGASAGFTSESYGKYPVGSSGLSNSSYNKNDDPFDHRIGGGYR